MTELPSKELLQRQLHKGLEAAHQRWENCTTSTMENQYYSASASQTMLILFPSKIV